jgi:lipopolysaccharide biosynthesis glycosyltransferase
LTKCSVAFICDSDYVIPTAVAITSLICNKNQDTYYDIYIIAVGLSEREIEKFYEFKESNTDIHIIKASLEKFEGLWEKGYITAATYLKFDLPDLIPSHDKLLYLDSDVIIQKDLSDLFKIDIKDYYVGAVKDVPLIDNNLNIKNYFNAGVMFLNLKLMRESNASTALLNIGKSANKLTYQDQDCLNIIFDKKVKLLPIIYNFFYNYFLQDKKYTLEYINECFGTYYSSLDNIKKDSFIIHLVGRYKPWIYFDSVFVHEWDEYFKKSPFKLHKLKRKSIKLKEFILLHKLTHLSYFFFKYWHDNGFKFAMGKVQKRLFNKGLNIQG